MEVRIARTFGVCCKLVESFADSWKKHDLSEAQIQFKVQDIKRCILTYFETSKLMDVASFLHPRFITDYTGSSYLSIVKDRLIREGSKYSNETIENAESTLSKDNNEGKNGDVTRFSCKQKKF